MTKIKKISAIEILDSRGNPTVKATVVLENGISGSAAVPSGASTGTYEALELRDNDARYNGSGVLNACENIRKKISKKLAALEVLDQKNIDSAMIELDGTENRSNLGSNAILAVSLATSRAAAASQNLPLYKYLAKTFKFKSPRKIPTAFFNIINGGAHADSGLSVQEFQIIPEKFNSFSEKMRAASEIFHKLKSLLANAGYPTGVGDEGGFAPRLDSHSDAFEFINKAIEESRYKGKVMLGIDAAASSFSNGEQATYTLKPENTTLDADRLIALYQEWAKKFQIVSLEDGLAEDDFENWKKLNQKFGKNILNIGDDLLVTNMTRLKKALDFKSVNAAIVKPNQIGTITETMNFIKMCQKNNIKTVVSHRSGETEDSFIADLAVASGSEYVKFGAPCRSERTAKYNRLLEIEKEI
ncbi:MAG TPA: phosphopyruvate hydratase [Candidatus Bathyarchaeia archaeon]|nr:phosphopyruvate hydratase [Candidatus Bathyarchaeia archaeon]